MVETSKNKHEEADGKASRIQQLARFWNWLQFPLVLLLLVGGGFWFNVQQDQRNLNLRQQQQATSLRIAADQQHETLLANYIDSISDLLVHNNLIHAGANDPWKWIADARTEETLQRLDPARKAVLMRFLYNTKLISNDARIINLAEDDLHNAQLSSLDIRDTYLFGIDMSGADLRQANLSYTTLSYANVRGANLAGADLHGSELNGADLSGANLSKANLKDALGISPDQLAKARSLAGAIMPDGSVHS
jgi:uncharacterized protein YjbI with pentapeptide repeats